MATNGNANGGGFWGYLIKPDKTATPQLQDLCLGLAKVIRDLEPGPDSELTPQRLAAFYKQTGGNYDQVFIHTDNHGISFMYRTLGCRHSLQPTANDFETPSVPCLSDAGFVRWQTLQLLLCPGDSVRSLQKAVEIWDVPRSDGGYFPKPIPTQCFPAHPDDAMERWYKQVVGSMNQDNYMKRLKNSPYHSPYPDVHDKRDSYFSAHGRPMDEEQAKLAAMRRRSSVPEVVSPLPEVNDRGSHWDTKQSRERTGRSHSAQRPPHHIRHRSYTNPPVSPHQSKYNHSSSPPGRRHGSNPDHHHTHNRPPSAYSQHYRQRSSGNRPKSPSTVDEDTGSDASSEASRNGRHSHQRKSDEERQSRRSSLWPPSFFKSHKRRHSSDASPRKIEAKPSLPARPDYYPTKHFKNNPPLPQPVPQSPYRPSPNPGVRFRNDMFINNPANSAPESPLHSHINGQPPPTIRYPDAPVAYPTQQMEGMAVGQGLPLSRRDTGSSGNDRQHNNDWDRNAQRRAGAPLRVSTVTGVRGRKYPDAGELSAGGEMRQDPARVRGSLPTMA